MEGEASMGSRGAGLGGGRRVEGWRVQGASAGRPLVTQVASVLGHSPPSPSAAKPPAWGPGVGHWHGRVDVGTSLGGGTRRGGARPWEVRGRAAVPWTPPWLPRGSGGTLACRPGVQGVQMAPDLPSPCPGGPSWEAAASWGSASGWPPRRGTSPPCPPPSLPCRPPICSSSPAPWSWPSASWAASGPSRRTGASCSP